MSTTKKSATKKTQTAKKHVHKKTESSVEEKKKNTQDIEQDTTSKIEQVESDMDVVTSEVETEHQPKQKKEVVIKAPRIIPKEEEKKSVKKNKEKQVEIERFNPQVKTGLTTEQVLQRKEQKLTNIVDKKNTKTYKAIIFSNLFSFFNLLCLLVAIALISVGAIGDCLFMFIVLANTLIGIIQEIKAKKTIEKISLVSSPTALVIRDKIEN